MIQVCRKEEKGRRDEELLYCSILLLRWGNEYTSKGINIATYR